MGSSGLSSLQLLRSSDGAAMSASSLFTARKQNKNFRFHVENNYYPDLDSRAFSHKRRRVLDSPASRFPRVPSEDLKWTGPSGLAPGHQALLPTSSVPTPTVPTHSSVITSPPQGTGYADELCGQPRACPAFHWPPHCSSPTGQPSSKHSGFTQPGGPCG